MGEDFVNMAEGTIAVGQKGRFHNTDY